MSGSLPLFQHKLTKTTTHQLYLKYGTNYFSIEEMKEGIGNIVSHMEIEEGQVSKKRINNTNASHTSGIKLPKGDIGTYSAHMSNESAKAQSNPSLSCKEKCCVFCNANHYTSECVKYPILTARQSRLGELHRKLQVSVNN